MEDRMEYPEGHRWLLFVSGSPVLGIEQVTVEFLRSRDEIFHRYSNEVLELFLSWLQERGDLYLVGPIYRFTNAAVEIAVKMRSGGFAVMQGSIFLDHPDSQASRGSGRVNESDLRRPLLSLSQRRAAVATLPPIPLDGNTAEIQKPRDTSSTKSHSPTKRARAPKAKAAPPSVESLRAVVSAPVIVLEPEPRVDLDQLTSLLLQAPPQLQPPRVRVPQRYRPPRVRVRPQPSHHFRKAVETFEAELQSLLASLKSV